MDFYVKYIKLLCFHQILVVLNFAFRIDPGFLSFLIASIIALLFDILTAGLRTYKIATANLVDSLRDSEVTIAEVLKNQDTKL